MSIGDNPPVVFSRSFHEIHLFLRSKWLGSCVAAEECGAGEFFWGESLTRPVGSTRRVGMTGEYLRNLRKHI